MRHYITYFSLIALHFSLTGCHTQRAVQAETCHETDTLQSHIVKAQTFIVDSLFNEMFISADSLSITDIPSAWSPTESGSLPLGGLSATAEMQRGVRLVASGVTFASRKSKVKEEKAKVCIEDTTSVHIRDTTAVKNQVDRQAIYEPPDIRTILIVFGLFFISDLIFSRR